MSNIASNSDYPFYIQYLLSSSTGTYFGNSSYCVGQVLINKGETVSIGTSNFASTLRYSNKNDGTDTITVYKDVYRTVYGYFWRSKYQRANCSSNFIGKNTTVGRIASA